MVGKIRLVILGIAGLVLVTVGVGMGLQFLVGSGTVTVLEPAWVKTPPQEVKIDGKPVDAAGERHRSFKLGKGSHTITLVDPGTKKERSQQVKITNGFTEIVVPAEMDQCVVDVDMTSGYGEDAKLAPTVRHRFQNEPFERPSSSYWSIEELPKEIDEHGTAAVLLNLPCPMLSMSDEKIAALLLDDGK